MPPSCGHGTKRKVATPEPDADVDTEEEEEEAAAGENNTGIDPNGYEEAASSYTKAKKACVDIINAVHKEYTQTFKLVTKGKKQKKEEKVWSYACPHRHRTHVVPNKKQKPVILSLTSIKIRDIEEEVAKVPKSTR